VTVRQDGQLAVAIRSEVSAVERRDYRRVEIIRQSPWLASRVRNGEVDRQWFSPDLLTYY
jgi:hypothetical protein